MANDNTARGRTQYRPLAWAKQQTDLNKTLRFALLALASECDANGCTTKSIRMLAEMAPIIKQRTWERCLPELDAKGKLFRYRRFGPDENGRLRRISDLVVLGMPREHPVRVADQGLVRGRTGEVEPAPEMRIVEGVPKAANHTATSAEADRQHMAVSPGEVDRQHMAVNSADKTATSAEADRQHMAAHGVTSGETEALSEELVSVPSKASVEQTGASEERGSDYPALGARWICQQIERAGRVPPPDRESRYEVEAMKDLLELADRERIKAVFEFARADDLWSQNVFTARDLRRHWNKLNTRYENAPRDQPQVIDTHSEGIECPACHDTVFRLRTDDGRCPDCYREGRPIRDREEAAAAE